MIYCLLPDLFCYTPAFVPVGFYSGLLTAPWTLTAAYSFCSYRPVFLCPHTHPEASVISLSMILFPHSLKQPVGLTTLKLFIFFSISQSELLKGITVSNKFTWPFLSMWCSDGAGFRPSCPGYCTCLDLDQNGCQCTKIILQYEDGLCINIKGSDSMKNL